MLTYIDTELKQKLYKEIPVLTAQIQALYRQFDRKFGLNGAKEPITFGLEEDLLGSYTPATREEQGHFHFSLLFIGYCVKNPLSKEDRMDLYKHEYAHYMQFHMEIPKEFQWKSGIHGSAWQYCCSLVKAAPTPYYKVGESMQEHDYERVLKNPWKDVSAPIRDRYRREKEYQNQKNSAVYYQIHEVIIHPKFGEGTIEEIEPLDASVRLHIRFGKEIKLIDQKWLLKTKYKKVGER